MAPAGGFCISPRLGSRLLRPANPGKLPGYGDIVIVAAIADVGAVVVADLDGLASGDGKRGGHADARAGLASGKVADAVEAGDASPPVVAVERDPGAGRDGVTQMALEGADRLLGLRLRNREGVVRGVLRVEPGPSVAV